MKNILIDTNIALDILLFRQGYKTGLELLSLINDDVFTAWFSAHSIDTLHYILKKKYSNTEAKELIKFFLSSFVILPTRSSSIDFDSKIDDFEDSIVVKGAYQFNLDAIITKNKKDFKNSRIPAYTPEEFLNIVSQSLILPKSQILILPKSQNSFPRSQSAAKRCI